MKVPNWLGPLLILVVFFLIVAYIGGRSESEWQKKDPEGYAQWQKELKAEGIPDPRR